MSAGERRLCSINAYSAGFDVYDLPVSNRQEPASPVPGVGSGVEGYGTHTALSVSRAPQSQDATRTGKGFIFKITSSGVKSWILRYERAGRERWLKFRAVSTP